MNHKLRVQEEWNVIYLTILLPRNKAAVLYTRVRTGTQPELRFVRISFQIISELPVPRGFACVSS